MIIEPDSRVPVLAGPGDIPEEWAELTVSGTGHFAAGCACCVPRGPLARALAAAWLDAVRDGRTLTGVVVRGTTPDALAAVLRSDLICGARFRIVP